MATDYAELVHYAKAHAGDPRSVALVLTAWEYTSLGPGIGKQPSTASDVALLLEAACGWRDYLLRAVMKEIGVEGRRVSFYDTPIQGSHAATELKIGGKWVFFDGTFGTCFVSEKGGSLLSYAEARAQWPDVVVRKVNLDGWQHKFVDPDSISARTAFSTYTDGFFYHPFDYRDRADSVSAELNSLYFGKKVTYNNNIVETPVEAVAASWRVRTDSGDRYSWIRISSRTDAEGRLDVRHTLNDDTSFTFTDWDQRNEYSWSKRTVTVTSNYLLDSRDVTYDDGHRIVYDSDQANANEWSSLTTHYASAKVLDYRVGSYDDGRSWIVDWDNGNNFAWSSFRDDYDAAGRLIIRTYAYDDGTIGTFNWSAVPTTDGTGAGDVLAGTPSTDYLRGFSGNDALFGSGGLDRMEGGSGNDTYHVDSLDDDVSERGGSGVDTVAAAVTYVLPTDVENLTLLDTALDGTGNAGDNAIVGNGLRNILSGLGGNDVLVGRAGDDLLAGGAGNDRIDGGPGADLLYGNAGADSFIWRSILDTGASTRTADVVKDFSFAQGDRLHLALIDADETAAGNQAFTFIGTAKFSGAAQIRYTQSDGETLVFLNTDRDSSFEGLIRLATKLVPTASWFVL